MAKKFKIESNPTFKEIVSIPRVGGDPIEVEFEFKYLTRRELAALYDKWQNGLDEFVSNVSKKSEEDFENGVEDITLSDATDMEIKMSVKQIKDITVGWGFEDEFSDENIERLIESSLHVSRVLTEKYQEAYTKVKLGN